MRAGLGVRRRAGARALAALAIQALALAALAAACAPVRAEAQTVMEVQAGGSSLLGGYGISANFWRQGMDGWIGMGYLDGLRIGAFVRAPIGKDTLRFGNDALIVRYPTDVFSNGYNLLVQGAGYQHQDARSGMLAFAGASSVGLAAPTPFLAARAEAAMGALFLRRRLSDRVRLTTDAVFAERQSVVSGIEWQPVPGMTAALAGGVGAGRPYGASSWTLQAGRLEVKSEYVWNPRRFRRAFVPAPTQTETDRENVSVTFALSPDLSVGLARQNFVQDSADARPPLRASGNSAFLGGRIGEFRLSAGVYDSRADSLRSLNSYLALGHGLTGWLDGELFLLHNRPAGGPSSLMPVVNLRERLSPRLGLTQQVSVSGGQAHVRFGGSLRTAIGEVGVDYQIVHQPFEPFNPFRSALNLTARLQLGRYSTSVGTYIQPDGRVDYSASAGTFLYLGEFGGVQPQRIGGAPIARYVFLGRVLDQNGDPVEGAAIDLEGETVFTNARGELLLRARGPRRAHPQVLLDDFLLPGRWRVVEVPSEVIAAPEDRAQPFEIRLERVTGAAP